LRKWLRLNDFLQADRSQPAQCSQEHWSDYRRRQAALALQRRPYGLTAETVIGALEDAEDYKAFEAAVAAGFDAETAVERELVLRLASLLWRLRRATAIDTGLLETPSEPQKVSDLDGATLANEQAVVRIQIATLENHTSLEERDD
jgi:hypothetical protein